MEAYMKQVIIVTLLLAIVGCGEQYETEKLNSICNYMEESLEHLEFQKNDPRLKDHEIVGQTVLNGCHHELHYLLELGADPNQGVTGANLKDVALQKNFPEVLNVLNEFNAKSSSELNLIAEQDSSKVARTTKNNSKAEGLNTCEKIQIDHNNGRVKRPLYRAKMIKHSCSDNYNSIFTHSPNNPNSRVSINEDLLSKGVKSVDPFIFASLNKLDTLKSWLLENGYDANKPYPKTQDLISYGASKTVIDLIDAGHDFNKIHQQGKRLIVYVSESLHEQPSNKNLLKHLIEKGASFERSNEDGGFLSVLKELDKETGSAHLSFVSSLKLNPEQKIYLQGKTPLQVEREKAALAKQNTQDEMTLALSQLDGCNRIQYLVENRKLLNDLNIIKSYSNEGYRSYDQGMFDAIKNRCAQAVINWGDKLKTPWVIEKKGKDYPLPFFVLVHEKNPDLAFSILSSKQYPYFDDKKPYQDHFYNLTEKLSQKNGTSNFNEVKQILNTGFTDYLSNETLQRSVNYAWYNGQNELASLIAKNSKAVMPSKAGEGLKNITFDGTRYEELKEHPKFQCSKVSKYNYASCYLNDASHLYRTIAGLDSAREALFQFVDNKLSRITVYLSLSKDHQTKLLNALSTKYKSKVSSVDGVSKIASQEINFSLAPHQLLGTYGLANWSGIFESKTYRDILTIDQPGRASKLDDIIFNYQEEKLAKKKADDEAKKLKTEQEKTNKKSDI